MRFPGAWKYSCAVRIWIARSGMLLGLALAGWVAWYFLAPLGLGWIVWALAGLVAAFIALELALRARRRGIDARALERWQASQAEPGARRAAIREVRSRIERARRYGSRFVVEHARLATILAELLESDERAAEAIAALASVPVDALDPLHGAVVRQARAQAYLAAGDLDGAEATLAAAPARTGEEVLDASLMLARAWVALGRARLDEAEEAARAVAAKAEPNDELHDEAQAILATSAHERGDHERARALLATLDEPGRDRLTRLGPRSVREILAPRSARPPIMTG